MRESAGQAEKLGLTQEKSVDPTWNPRALAQGRLSGLKGGVQVQLVGNIKRFE